MAGMNLQSLNFYLEIAPRSQRGSIHAAPVPQCERYKKVAERTQTGMGSARARAGGRRTLRRWTNQLLLRAAPLLPQGEYGWPELHVYRSQNGRIFAVAAASKPAGGNFSHTRRSRMCATFALAPFGIICNVYRQYRKWEKAECTCALYMDIYVSEVIVGLGYM